MSNFVKRKVTHSPVGVLVVGCTVSMYPLVVLRFDSGFSGTFCQTSYDLTKDLFAGMLTDEESTLVCFDFRA